MCAVRIKLKKEISVFVIVLLILFPVALAGDFSYTIITDCTSQTEISEEDCSEIVTNVYNYSIHGDLPSGQTQTLFFPYTADDVGCYNRTDVRLAYYDETNSEWRMLDSSISGASDGENYNISASTTYIGYIAIVKTDTCVATYCPVGESYTLSPPEMVGVGDDLTISLCNFIPECNANPDGVCKEDCVIGVDPDCGSCTSSAGDCCLPLIDSVCDIDCFGDVDPDCCDKNDEGCCIGNAELTGFSGCDINCGKHDYLGTPFCEGSSSAEGDGCYPMDDGACDPDCREWIDPDCCGGSEPNCCDVSCDGTCDADCIIGTDADCWGGCFNGTDGTFVYAGGEGGGEGTTLGSGTGPTNPTAIGASIGALAGMLVGGPLGALIGAVIGGAAGYGTTTGTFGDVLGGLVDAVGDFFGGGTTTTTGPSSDSDTSGLGDDGDGDGSSGGGAGSGLGGSGGTQSGDRSAEGRESGGWH